MRPIHSTGSAGTYPQREEIVSAKKRSLKSAEENINVKLSELQKISNLLKVL